MLMPCLSATFPFMKAYVHEAVGATRLGATSDRFWLAKPSKIIKVIHALWHTSYARSFLQITSLTVEISAWSYWAF